LTERSSVVSACENSVNGWIRRRAVLVMILCFVPEHWLDFLRLVDRFDWIQGSVWWVSVKIVREWLNKKKSDAGHVTLFCSRALAKCSAPWSPIPLLLRRSVVSVC
jgi:hypothetical protein